MKRLTPLILAIPLALSACSSTDDAPTPTSTSSTTTSTTSSQRTTESSTVEATSTEPSPIESAPPAEPAEGAIPNKEEIDQPQEDVQQDVPAPAPVEEEPAPAPAPLYEQPSPVEESPVQEAPAYTGGGGSGSCADIGHKVYIGDSDYAPKLDRNGDGVGCEAYPG